MAKLLSRARQFSTKIQLVENLELMRQARKYNLPLAAFDIGLKFIGAALCDNNYKTITRLGSHVGTSMSAKADQMHRWINGRTHLMVVGTTYRRRYDKFAISDTMQRNIDLFGHLKNDARFNDGLYTFVDERDTTQIANNANKKLEAALDNLYSTCVCASAQNAWDKFFKPMAQDHLKAKAMLDEESACIIVRRFLHIIKDFEDNGTPILSVFTPYRNASSIPKGVGGSTSSLQQWEQLSASAIVTGVDK